MKQFDEILTELALLVKKRGFKKNRLTWYKAKEKLTVVFSIQRSQYDANMWFYLFGICLHEIADGNVHSISSCQVQYRIDNVMLPAESIVNLLDRWESVYGTLHSLRVCAVQGKLPGQHTVKAVRYLTSINICSL